jgi:hypothetical protein
MAAMDFALKPCRFMDGKMTGTGHEDPLVPPVLSAPLCVQ